MKKFFSLAGCIGVLLLSGCAATRQYVALPDQAKTIDDASKGRIYVVRPAFMGCAVSMNVSDDGQPIGHTGPRGYLCWERPPGSTIISSASEGVSEVPLTVQAGDVYYLFQHVRPGVVFARGELEIVSQQKGEKALKHCHAPGIEAPPPSGVAPVPPTTTSR